MLAPAEAKVGDWIVIFEAGNMPYVIRRVEGGPWASKEWKFIGEAYVHGLMTMRAYDLPCAVIYGFPNLRLGK